MNEDPEVLLLARSKINDENIYWAEVPSLRMGKIVSTLWIVSWQKVTFRMSHGILGRNPSTHVTIQTHICPFCSKLVAHMELYSLCYCKRVLSKESNRGKRVKRGKIYEGERNFNRSLISVKVLTFVFLSWKRIAFGSCRIQKDFFIPLWSRRFVAAASFPSLTQSCT